VMLPGLTSVGVGTVGGRDCAAVVEGATIAAPRHVIRRSFFMAARSVAKLVRGQTPYNV
jgi:hypothetical protein